MSETNKHSDKVIAAADEQGPHAEPAINYDEGVTVGVSPGATPYHFWTDLELVKRYMVVGDECEIDLVQQVIRIDSQMSGHIASAARACEISHATAELRSACELAQAWVKAIMNLVTYQRGGVQSKKVIRVSGPSVGLAAKLERFYTPANDSSDAQLSDDIECNSDHFDSLATRYGQTARHLRSQARDEDAWFHAHNNGLPLPTFKAAREWERLSEKALMMLPVLSKILVAVRVGRRKIILVEEDEINSGRLSSRAEPHRKKSPVDRRVH